MVSFISALRVLRGPLFVVGLFLLIVPFADQAKEIFVIFLENPKTYFAPIVATAILAILFSFVVFFAGHALIVDACHPDRLSSLSSKKTGFVVLHVTSALPILMMAFSIIVSGSSYS